MPSMLQPNGKFVPDRNPICHVIDDCIFSHFAETWNEEYFVHCSRLLTTTWRLSTETGSTETAATSTFLTHTSAWITWTREGTTPSASRPCQRALSPSRGRCSRPHVSATSFDCEKAYRHNFITCFPIDHPTILASTGEMPAQPVELLRKEAQNIAIDICIHIDMIQLIFS